MQPKEENAHLDYVAKAVIARMRGGDLPSSEDAASLNVQPMIDRLREAVEKEDRSWLIAIVLAVHQDAVAGLAVSLLRHQMDPELLATYEQQWEKFNPYMKYRIMWRMLDSTDLNHQRWRPLFLSFILEHWTFFRDLNETFYGGKQAALANIQKRISDPTFPKQKRWIYACASVGVVPNGQDVRTLLSSVSETGDEFTKKAIDTVDGRFFNQEYGEDPS